MEKLRIYENKIIENKEKNKLKNFEHNDLIFFKQKDKSKIGIGRIISFNTELKLNNIHINSNKKVSLANYLKILNNLNNSKYVYGLINSLSKETLESIDENNITNEKNANNFSEKKERNILSYFNKKEKNISNSTTTLKKCVNHNNSIESEHKTKQKQNGKVAYNGNTSKTKVVNEEKKKASKIFYIIQSFETYKYLIQYKKAFKHYKIFFHKKWESIKTSYCKNLQNEITFELAMKLFEIKRLYTNNINLQNIMINNLMKIYKNEKHFHADYFFLNLIKKIDVRIILQNNVLLTNDDISDIIFTYDKNKKNTNEKVDLINTDTKSKSNNSPEKSTSEQYAHQNNINNDEQDDEKSHVEDFKNNSNTKKVVRKKKVVEGECFQYELKGNLLAKYRSPKGVIYRGLIKNIFKNKNTILSYFLIVPSFFWFNDSYYFSCLNIDIDIFEILEIIKKIDHSKILLIDNLPFLKYQNYQNLKKLYCDIEEKNIKNLLKKEEENGNMHEKMNHINEEKEGKNEEIQGKVKREKLEDEDENTRKHKQDEIKQEQIENGKEKYKKIKKRKKNHEQNQEEKKKEKDEKIKKRKKNKEEEVKEKEKKGKGRKKEQKEQKEVNNEKENRSRRNKKEKEKCEEGKSNLNNKIEINKFYKSKFSLENLVNKENDQTNKKSIFNLNHEGKNTFFNKITDFFKISENKQKINNVNEKENCNQNNKNEKIKDNNKSFNNENKNINNENENINNENKNINNENENINNKNENINNESEKLNNKNQNINYESEKINNESEKISNESEKLNNKNENINNENEKINNESEKINNENEKINNESEKINNESEKINNESEKLNNESEKINNKNENINNESEKLNNKNQNINNENKNLSIKNENINIKTENISIKNENIFNTGDVDKNELSKHPNEKNCVKIENSPKHSDDFINKEDNNDTNNYTLKIFNDMQINNCNFLKNKSSEHIKRLIEIEKLKKIEILYRYCKGDINILLYIYVMHIYINKLCKHIIVKVLNPKCKNLKKKKYEDRDFILTPLIGYSYANFYYLKLNKIKKSKTDKKVDRKNYKLMNQKLIKKERKKRKKSELKNEIDTKKEMAHNSLSSDSSFKTKIVDRRKNSFLKDVNKKIKKIQMTKKCSKKHINLYLWGIFNWNYKKTLRISFNNISNRKISNFDVYNFFFYNFETLSDLSEIDKDLNKLINIYKNIKTVLYQNSSIYGDLLLLKVTNNFTKTNSDEELINFWLKTLDELCGIKEGFYNFF